MMNKVEIEKQLAAAEAVKFIKDHQVVGLGTGSTAYYAIKAIGEMVHQGLKIQAVPTSQKTKVFAESLNIPMIDINCVEAIDITIDGADEFTADLKLIKGGGGALLREKIVASITTLEIIIADASKKVEQLGKFKLPVEVVPFAAQYVLHQINLLNGIGTIRTLSNNIPFITDQGNYIIDADFGLISDPDALSTKLNQIEGMVGHGLFINLADMIIMGKDNDVVRFQ